MAKDSVIPYLLLGIGAYVLLIGKKAIPSAGGASIMATPTKPASGNRAATVAPVGAYTSSPYVKWVQATLNYLNGANLEVDGAYGALTRGAVAKFQQQWGLSADGVVGPETDYYLKSAMGMPGYTDQPYSNIPTGEVYY